MRRLATDVALSFSIAANHASAIDLGFHLTKPPQARAHEVERAFGRGPCLTRQRMRREAALALDLDPVALQNQASKR